MQGLHVPLFSSPVSVTIKKKCGSINCQKPCPLNILTLVNIPPVVNLIVQTATRVSVFLLAETIWVCTSFTTLESGNVWSLAHNHVFVLSAPSIGTISQQQLSQHLHLLLRILKKRSEDHVSSLLTFWFSLSTKENATSAARTLRKCSGLHLFCFYPPQRPLFTCAQSNNHMCNCLKKWKSAVASFI